MTTGTRSKLCVGGGEGVCHSRPVAFHVALQVAGEQQRERYEEVKQVDDDAEAHPAASRMVEIPADFFGQVSGPDDQELGKRKVGPHHHEGEHVVALDASPEVLEINRDKVKSANVEFRQADLFNWQPDTQYEKLHTQMIQWINAEKNSHGVDFTVINGDLFHDDVSFLEPVKKSWNNLAMPYYVSHGNHDKTEEAHWKTVWNLPWHFSFEHGDVGVIVLNTADAKGTYICPDVDWTKSELEKLSSKKQLFVIMHITPFTWTKNGIACPAIVDLFDQQKNLKAVFHEDPFLCFGNTILTCKDLPKYTRAKLCVHQKAKLCNGGDR